MTFGYAQWAMMLVICIPVLIVVFNEVIDRFAHSENPYTSSITTMRDVLLPLLVILVLFKYVFVFEENHLAVRIFSTVFWSALVISIFRVSQILVGTGTYTEDNWRRHVPQMFLRLPPYTIIGLIVFHMIQNLWSLPLRELATTLGIGSIVMAFALQDTLSNLVSGILLAANSPFKTDEWVDVGDYSGKVVSVNWHYTSIETEEGDLIIIPNGSISSESISNHSRPSKICAITLNQEFSFSESPNDVKTMLYETLADTPGILHDPAPAVALTSMSDPIMNYEICFWIGDYADKTDITDVLLSRVWYATQRHKIDLPTPAYDIYTNKRPISENKRAFSTNQIFDFLSNVSPFSLLEYSNLMQIAEKSHTYYYSQTELVMKRTDKEQGVYVVNSGAVVLSMLDENGEEHEVETLGVSGLFGESGLTGRPLSPLIATAKSDTNLFVLPHDMINDVINYNRRFAEEFSTLTSRRRVNEKLITKIAQPEVERPDILDKLIVGER